MRRSMMALFVALGLAAIASPSIAQTAGTLISSEPVVETLPGMQAWRVRYWTRSEENRPIEVTGMVVAPRDAQPPAPRRVIAWAHGTSGVVEECGLSANPAFFEATPALSEMVAAGYVVVAPDYPGLGSGGTHGYLVGRETARSVIDSVRAARSIAGAYAGRDFAVWGESQGGHAALWTAIEARGYARDLNLVATAAAAPPTDLPENLRQAGDQNARAFLSALLAFSWAKRFDAPLDRLFGPLNRGVANQLAQKCISLKSTPNFGTLLGILSIRNALKDKDLGATAGWSRLARRNSVRAGDVPGPVLIAQSVADPLVAPAVTRNFAQELCRKRRAVTWVSIPGGDHAHSARDSAGPTLAWISDRFAGKPVPTDCGRF